MKFGTRAKGSVLAAIGHVRPAAGRRPVIRTAIAGLILGFGSITAGTSLVQASERGGIFDFFGQLFGAPPRQAEARPTIEPRRRYTSLPDARHVTAPRSRQFSARRVPLIDANGRANGVGRRTPVTAATAVSAAGPQSVCVRTCDGYVFPLGARHSDQDVPLHQAACAAACPDAPTALYTMPWGKTELDQSVSLKGQPYLAAAWANVYRQKRVENCHCRTPGSTASPLSIDRDPTVQIGDVVATKTSAAVVTRMVRGDVQMEDYRSTRSLSRPGRRFIEMRVGALQREAAERAFRRSMRTAAKGDRVRVAEASDARIRIGSADGSDAMGEPALQTPGFAPVRVLVPSPFVY